MSFALTAGVTGLQAHQKMLDVAGNNLANVNTTAFKASRIVFSELLSETIKKASQPTANVGGTNPQQMGSGVGVAGISPNMTQGNIVNTGNPLDLAIEGEGYFVLYDGQKQIYTRAGAFAVDSDSVLIDPATGFRVQRIGSVGEADGFQIPGDNNIHVPYDVAMPAKATSKIIISGNLSANASLPTPQKQTLLSNIPYTYNNGTLATLDTEIDQLDQFSGGSLPNGQMNTDINIDSGRITITGFHKDGTPLSTGLTFDVTAGTTLGDFINHLNNNVLTDAVASLVNGKIQIVDKSGGYSKTDISFSYSAVNGSSQLKTPAYFEMDTVGGDEIKSINITAYDSQGGKHVISGAFVRTNQPNTWDMVLTSVQGDVHKIQIADRRIESIQFDAADGSFAGLGGSDEPKFTITFEHDPATPQTIEIQMGTVGHFDGLTQFKGDSTAVAREQDGYEAGRLATVSVDNEGILIGSFSNGIKKSIATLKIALFQNTAGLEGVGNGYYIPSANSGEAIETQALAGGAGSIHGGALEKSNTDVASEFVNLIQAQNGFQANARTIRVANEILKELTSLIR